MLGRPVAHSLSPVLHRAAYAALGLTWTYEAIDCGAGELVGVLADHADYAGFSCTMPLKHAALDVAAEVSRNARIVGAANTLLPRGGGGWLAENTDAAGIAAALAERDVRPRRVTVLGAGGTAQAAVVALRQLGVLDCAVLVRDRARADAVLATAARAGVQLTVALLAPEAPELAADLVISTLPARAADALAARHWSARQTVLDVAYDPWPSALADAVGESDGTVVSGALMLLHQAAEQVHLMTGQAPPLAAMRAALLAAAPGCGA